MDKADLDIQFLICDKYNIDDILFNCFITP